jgi:hypothetical protein
MRKELKVKTILVEAWHMLVPLPNDRHGPLSPLLLSLTFLTGLVVAIELVVIAATRHHFFGATWALSIVQVMGGGALVFIAALIFGNA